MRRALVLSLVLVSLACRREEPVVTDTAQSSTGVTNTATTVEPQDMSKAIVTETVPLEPMYIVQSRLGTGLARGNTVATEKTEFAPGEPIYLTMWLKDSPAHLQTSALWFDEKKEKVHEERISMNGKKVVTFSMTKKLPPGKYLVEGYWGGNIACDYEFTVK